MNAFVAPFHLKLFFLIIFKWGSYFLPQHWEFFFTPLYDTLKSLWYRLL